MFTLDDGASQSTVQTKSIVGSSVDTYAPGYHRISVTYDSAAPSLKIYRNSVLDEENTSAALTNGTLNAKNLTAGRGHLAVLFFTGRMYDFRVWNDVRTQAEIKANRVISLVGDEDGLEGYWPCDEGSGTTLDDKDSNDNDGTLSAATMWQSNAVYGEPVINAGTGSRVDIVFADERFHGQTYKIYRSYEDAASPFFLTQFEVTAPAVAGTPDANNTYTDDILDRSLGDPPYLHGDQPNPVAIPSVVHANRIFIASGNRVYWSDIANEESFWWEDETDTDGHNETGNYIQVYPDDGDTITALASDHDSVIIFKANHAYRLYGRRPQDFQLRPVIPGAGNAVVIGCPNQNSVCATPNGLVFYWNRAVYLFAGGGIRKISDPIAEALDVSFGGAYANDEYVGAAIGYWAENGQVWLSLPNNSSNGTANVSFIYCLETGRWIGYRNAGYQGAHSVRSSSLWQTAFADEKFIGGEGGVGATGDVMEIASTPGTVPSGGASAELSPFYGRRFNTHKNWLHLDIEYESSASGSFNVQYKVDDGSYTSVSISMAGETNGKKYRERVNVAEKGRMIQVKFTSSAGSNKWKVTGLTYEWQEEGALSR
jgi:hypothetical protein